MCFSIPVFGTSPATGVEEGANLGPVPGLCDRPRRALSPRTSRFTSPSSLLV